ncbi:CatB-related O-acetyltransferase [Fulvivirga sediminis]|uniref:Antibiotic acetyltransferase n=1 Tax=Fulvivirga sediminis TaxID=2803949 RepID=A0A937F5M0_9BACT|nr:CatB-related O-acetyltransferase [Fulvivirga sediminis]MBL3655387.1 hypothetical protein [Fulvivirga sediminis]
MLKKVLNFIAHYINERNIILGKSSVYISDSSIVEGSFIKGEVTIGQKCTLKRVHIDGKVSIGDFSFLSGPNIFIHSKIDQVKIGKFCSIARNVDIQSHNHDINKITTSSLMTNFFNGNEHNELVSMGDISIGNDVWIGAKCTILGGVTIGNGAVIGANTLVNKDVPAYSIVVGNPMRVVKKRFSDSQILELDALKWWDKPIDEIREIYEGFEKSR